MESIHLQQCLDRYRQGDADAAAELLAHSCDRLRQLAHLMLKGYARLKRWEDTDDVLQNALLRLHRALLELRPATVRDYLRLATLQIRRELLDLVRHHYGPQGPAARHQTNAGADQSLPSRALYDGVDISHEPSRLANWTEFHQKAQELPDEEQEVFDLLWYQGMAANDAAALLNVSARTVKRRWQTACLKLHDALGGQVPGT
jgi:RNA polymerase sigma-70 factor (ECF subfamily)